MVSVSVNPDFIHRPTADEIRILIRNNSVIEELSLKPVFLEDSI